MNTLARPLGRSFALLVFACLTFALAAPSASASPDGVSIARLAVAEGETFVQGAFDDSWTYGQRNMTIEPGDTLLAGDDGRLELELPYGIFVRMWHAAQLDIDEIGRSSRLRLAAGSIYVQARSTMSEKDLTIETPAGEIFCDRECLFRIDLSEMGEGIVRVMNGAIEVRSHGTATEVGEGEQVEIGVDFPPVFTTRSYERDQFDEWNDERMEYVAYCATVSEYVDEEIIGFDELDYYGDWVYVHEYTTYCWIPRVITIWRPYRYGYWAWSRGGWCWVSHEPWGYAPYHYGRWAWGPRYGWAWIPGRRWGPAWVRWYRSGRHIGWTPLDPWHRPRLRRRHPPWRRPWADPYPGHDPFRGFTFGTVASFRSGVAAPIESRTDVLQGHRPDPISDPAEVIRYPEKKLKGPAIETKRNVSTSDRIKEARKQVKSTIPASTRKKHQRQEGRSVGKLAAKSKAKQDVVVKTGNETSHRLQRSRQVKKARSVSEPKQSRTKEGKVARPARKSGGSVTARHYDRFEREKSPAPRRGVRAARPKPVRKHATPSRGTEMGTRHRQVRTYQSSGFRNKTIAMARPGGTGRSFSTRRF